MSAQAQQARYLPRGHDYLGDLGAKLRDLQGYATLAYELVQNAHDAGGVSRISFDVRADGLVVENNGVFSDCGQVESRECLWKLNKGHRCDFHRFQLVASGDKRGQAGTLGAFGIGFIAVYQITDHPELISAGRHWILREEQSEERRIEVCPGCEKCRASDLPGTRFYLPWAQDSNSVLRRALNVDPVTIEARAALLEELERSLPTAILFLEGFDAVEIKKDGRLRRCLRRIPEGQSLIVTGGESDQFWHLLRGSFGQRADEIRKSHPDRIEDKRSAEVTLALPDESSVGGLLCAFLPTQHETGLPFHVNADFFPTSNRKWIIFQSDYQSDWNRAAVQAAADALRHRLDQLPSLLGPKRLWEMIEAVRRTSDEAARGQCDPSLGLFWKSVAAELKTSRVIFTTTSEWKSAQETLLLSEREEEAATPVLEGLGVPLVHGDLRPHFNLLRSKDVSVQLADVPHIVRALHQCGLVTRTETEALPMCLREAGGIPTLWRELGLLLKRRHAAEEQKRCEQELAGCAVALGWDGALWPCRSLFRADQETKALFGRIAPGLPFLECFGNADDSLEGLCPEFSVRHAVEQLARLSDTELAQATVETRLDPAVLLRWFETRRDQIIASPTLRDRLVALPVFPSSAGLRPLSTLVLAGDFIDPIGVANVLDLDCLGGRREFLQELGAEELTFQRYVADYVPQALNNPTLPSDKRRKVVGLLARRLGEIRGDPAIRRALAEVLIVECEDGCHCRPADAYFRSGVIKEVLGDKVHFATVPREDEDAVRDLYRWLGVADRPTYPDIVGRVSELVAGTPNDRSRESIRTIFRHLGERIHANRQDVDSLGDLRAIAWLPGRGQFTRWYRPDGLYASFQDYLFGSQATFLDIPRDVQSAATAFLEYLKIKTAPEVSKVVAHLQRCCESGEIVNKEVYRFLNDQAQDPMLASLKDSPCLLLPNNTYVMPSAVFWGDHPFGRFRHRLGPELRRYGALFDRLGVRDAPDHRDARQLMLEIAEEFGAFNRCVDEEAHAVLCACWRMLETALSREDIREEDLVDLGQRKVIPNVDRFPYPPEWMFFEDRAGLAKKFGPALRGNVIQRLQGAWRAMAAAGVRSLWNVTESELVECADPTDDDLILDRLNSRQVELLRILEPDQVNGPPVPISTTLKDLRCLVVHDLRVRYTLPALNRLFSSEPEAVPAHLHREANALYFVRRNGETPWASVARELALTLSPESEPGRLALGIKEVLASETEEAARSVLDELGFARFTEAPVVNSGGGTTVVDLGGKTTTTTNVETAIGAILGGAGPGPGPMPEEFGRTEVSGGDTGGQTSRTTRSATSRDKRQGRLRTYVVPTGQEGDGNGNDHSQTDSQVERAGIMRVLEYERSSGRSPNEMPRNHEGYDIESADATGQIARYIEVKSISGKWGSLGAPVSKPQFDKASELGTRFWLYVVEHAQDSGFKIYRVQDPARQVNQFLYDTGWQALAEEDESATPSQDSGI